MHAMNSKKEWEYFKFTPLNFNVLLKARFELVQKTIADLSKLLTCFA